MTASPTNATSESPSDELREEGRRVFERVLVLVDFQTSPRVAVGAAFELLRTGGSRVCLFSMPEISGGDDFLAGLGAIHADLGEQLKGRLARFIENVAPELVGSVEVRARFGVDVISALRDEAKRWEATLIVAAADSHGGIFLRSPAEKLVHGIDVPVLLLPAAARRPRPT